MFDFIKINFPGFNKLSQKIENSSTLGGWWKALLLGIVFALAFCPYSGVLYFGMLIPLTLSSVSGLYLPLIFAIATGLPVIIVAYLLAFSISSIGGFYNRVKIFEKWFRRVIAIIFILVGLYYIKIFFF
jgi:threonine/homoserine/homoserine lactone efflux protein